MKKTLLVLTALCWAAGMLATPSAEPPDVNGHWEMRVTTSRGTRTSDLDFVQDGENLTVTMTNPQSGSATGQGTIKGVDIAWSIMRTSPRGSVTFNYSGKVDGETMSGDIKTSDSAAGTWTAARKKPDAPILSSRGQ